MQNEGRGCKAIMRDGSICGRPIKDQKEMKCVLHWDMRADKGHLFRSELDKLFRDPNVEAYDLTGIVFPDHGFKIPRIIDKDAYFQKCKFYGVMDFGVTSILNILSIPRLWSFSRRKPSIIAGLAGATDSPHYPNCKFLGNVFFHDSEFLSIVSFMNAEFKKLVRFDSTKFQDIAVFAGARFNEEVILFDTKFKSIVSFGGTEIKKGEFNAIEFPEKVDMSYSNFGEISFSGCVFQSEVNFFKTQVMEEGNFTGVGFMDFANFTKSVFHGNVTFENLYGGPHTAFFIEGDDEDGTKVFKGKSSLRYANIDDMQMFIIRNVSLKNCLMIGATLTRAVFDNVEWATRGRLVKRNVIYDEIDDNEVTGGTNLAQSKQLTKYNDMARIYRQLQINYIANYRYAEAGHFFIGEQEMMRKAKGPIRQYFCLAFLYRLASYYGESHVLPFVWIALCLILSPAFWLFCGIDLSNDLTGANAQMSTVYAWSWNPSDLILAKSDYWKSFSANLSFITLNRSELSRRLVGFDQRALAVLELLLIAIFTTLFLLALRRKFKRKSF